MATSSATARDPNGTPEIVPEEAEIVRGIYKSFLDGETPGSIARLLTARGVPSPGGKGKWHQTTVRSILQNEKYYGSALLQKTFTTDFLTHRKKKNDGELPQYHIENSHPAIVTKEQWDLVQVELERRSRMPGRFSPKGPTGQQTGLCRLRRILRSQDLAQLRPVQDRHLAVQ